jgi:hypothetical protein
VTCADKFERVGYELVPKPNPVTKDQIPAMGYFAANVDSRCDSMKDYMQLWAYTFTHHKIVVLVDVASYMLQPVDELYDAMLLPYWVDPKSVRLMGQHCSNAHNSNNVCQSQN